MFIQINDWNNLPNSGVPLEELAAPWAQLWRGLPRLPASGHFASQLTFPLLLSQPQAPKAAEPRPSPFLSLTLSQTHPLFSPDNIATPIPPLGQSLVPSLLGHMEPLTFPGKPRLLQDQSRMFPDFILDSYPKGPITSGQWQHTGGWAISRMMSVSVSIVFIIIFCDSLLDLLLALSSLQST